MVAACTTNVQLRERGARGARPGQRAAGPEAFAYAIERRPADAKANYGLGLAYLELNRPLDAQLAFEKALSVKHDDPELTDEILDGIAESLFRQERFEQLHAFLDETAGDYGESDDYLRQARYLVKMGDLDAAVVAFRKAAYFAPEGDAEPYLEMADVLRLDQRSAQCPACAAIRLLGGPGPPRDSRPIPRVRQGSRDRRCRRSRPSRDHAMRCGSPRAAA